MHLLLLSSASAVSPRMHRRRSACQFSQHRRPGISSVHVGAPSNVGEGPEGESPDERSVHHVHCPRRSELDPARCRSRKNDEHPGRQGENRSPSFIGEAALSDPAAALGSISRPLSADMICAPHATVSFPSLVHVTAISFPAAQAGDKSVSHETARPRACFQNKSP
jgi:hypothetical protein